MKCRVCDSHDPVLPLTLCSELWNDEFLIPILTTVPHLMLLLRGIEKHCWQTILLIYSFSGVLVLPELITSDKHAHAHTPSGWKCTSRSGHVRIYHCENCCFWGFFCVYTQQALFVLKMPTAPNFGPWVNPQAAFSSSNIRLQFLFSSHSEKWLCLSHDWQTTTEYLVRTPTW